ncbi:hypothetical protein AB0L82_20785 [Nocardia sp. NPDC052001]|uniref:hypothetical protein n=1 Tax=Nocardia sp. NPDC052001 TaxID=3154853 RepID=UPI00341DD1E3
MPWDAWVLILLISVCGAIVLLCVAEDVRDRRRFAANKNRTVRIQIRDRQCITTAIGRDTRGRHRGKLARS